MLLPWCLPALLCGALAAGCSSPISLRVPASGFPGLPYTAVRFLDHHHHFVLHGKKASSRLPLPPAGDREDSGRPHRSLGATPSRPHLHRPSAGPSSAAGPPAGSGGSSPSPCSRRSIPPRSTSSTPHRGIAISLLRRSPCARGRRLRAAPHARPFHPPAARLSCSPPAPARRGKLYIPLLPDPRPVVLWGQWCKLAAYGGITLAFASSHG